MLPSSHIDRPKGPDLQSCTGSNAVLRILSGSHGGRVIRAPKGRHTRPTASRVRGAIFDMLAHHPTHACPCEGTRVLDLYAGSGALGIEALSRGASGAVLVERDRSAAAILRRNVRDLALEEQAEVWQLDARRAVARLAAAERRFELLLLDPPYAETNSTSEIIQALVSGGLVAPGALLVLEHAADQEAPDAPGLDAPLARRWGDTEVLFYRHGGS
ncbi:MAG: 16S rRNA (guanine(966)-N(2))-methyltransferase RsmD [bacterium]